RRRGRRAGRLLPAAGHGRGVRRHGFVPAWVRAARRHRGRRGGPHGHGRPAAGMTVAVAFTWLGMVLGISFLEAPLKFRAPGVTLQLGLGIGRLVFAALNRAEVVLALAVLVSAVVLAPAGAVWVWLAIAVVVLVVQLAVVRPPLSRRS